MRLKLISCLLALIGALLCSGDARAENIDGIAAVVNNEIITLSDVRIASAFGLLPGENLDVLEKKIDIKLVLQMTSENISLAAEELDAKLQGIMDLLGNRVLLEKLAEFDLELKDLKAILQEQLEYEKIMALKFSQGVFVNLQEIESYYNQIYVVRQEGAGEQARPMMEILDELESAIKIDKTSQQIATWLKNLRREAVIQVYTDRFPEYFK